MIDPSNALHLFQNELLHAHLPLQPGVIYPDLYLVADFPNGKVRHTYVRLENRTITAFVSFIQSDPVNGVPRMQVGYAVPEAYRNQGRAKEVVNMAISELRHGFKQYGAFFVEAIVGTDNKPSQRVAEYAISANPVSMIDEFSGLPALQYLRKIE